MKKLSRSVAGKVVLVTGAASGMGRATAQLFGAEGAHVAVTDRDEAGAQAVAAQITADGGSAQAWHLDVADAGRIAAVVDEVARHFGGLDIVVNNAGVARMIPIDHPEYDTVWHTMLGILLTSQQRLVRAALPWLRRSASPRVVNIASTEALGATANNSAYAAAKAGVTGLTRGLAVELGKEGITVNCICPGPILTSMTARISEKDRETYARRRTALRRYGDPEEVAHMILSLCLPAASFITGATIPVDGGLVVRGA